MDCGYVSIPFSYQHRGDYAMNINAKVYKPKTGYQFFSNSSYLKSKEFFSQNYIENISIHENNPDTITYFQELANADTDEKLLDFINKYGVPVHFCCYFPIIPSIRTLNVLDVDTTSIENANPFNEKSKYDYVNLDDVRFYQYELKQLLELHFQLTNNDKTRKRLFNIASLCINLLANPNYEYMYELEFGDNEEISTALDYYGHFPLVQLRFIANKACMVFSRKDTVSNDIKSSPQLAMLSKYLNKKIELDYSQHSKGSEKIKIFDLKECLDYTLEYKHIDFIKNLINEYSEAYGYNTDCKYNPEAISLNSFLEDNQISLTQFAQDMYTQFLQIQLVDISIVPFLNFDKMEINYQSSTFAGLIFLQMALNIGSSSEVRYCQDSFCGKMYITSKTSRRIYCSSECAHRKANRDSIRRIRNKRKIQ